MPRKKRTGQNTSDEFAELKNRLEETEGTLQAIRQGLVDALLVKRSNGTQVVTLNDADFPYHMMVESMNEGAVTLIPDGTIFYCNSRFSEMVQIKTESLIGTQFRDLILPEEQKGFRNLFTKAGEAGTRGEFCLKRIQGNCIPVQLSIYQLGTEAATGISIIVTDMTEHKRAEQALQKSESLFRLIATNSPDVIFAQDRDLRYTWIINPTPPLQAEQVIGKTDRDLLPVEQAQRLADLKRKIIKTGVSVREELILSPSGSQRWFDAIYQPLYDQAHQIVGILCYARDITERVHAEEKIRSLASQLTVAEQEERQRISQVLHDDLQQRLFALKAQLSLLNSIHWKDQLSPGVHFDLDEIQASLSEAINVTRNLSIDLSPVVLKGGDLIESMTWLASRMLNQHGLQVDLELNGNFDHLDDNLRMFLFQSVSELLFNVVKHAGMLKAKVTLDQDDQHAYITIRDGGKGFDVKEVMSNSKMAHGLLIVQDRLSLMGCKMEITSEPGKGTKVVIKVPIETS
jgi:two-component system CheB/CheR fusion protein